MSRPVYQQRVNALMAALRAAGFTPIFRPTQQPDVEDDEVDIEGHPDVSVQVCSMSGDPVNVTATSGEGADKGWAFHDAETIVAAVAKVVELTEAVHG